LEIRWQFPIRHQVEHADFHSGTSRGILRDMLRCKVSNDQHTRRTRDMQETAGQCQSFSGSTGIADFLGAAAAGGGAVTTSELTCGFTSGGPAGLVTVAVLSTGAVTGG